MHRTYLVGDRTERDRRPTVGASPTFVFDNGGGEKAEYHKVNKSGINQRGTSHQTALLTL